MYSAQSEEEPSRARKLLPLFVVLGAAAAGGLAIWIAVLVNRPPAPKTEHDSSAGEASGEHAAKALPAAEQEQPAAAEPTASVAKQPEPQAAPEPAAAAAPAAEQPAAQPSAAAPAAPPTAESKREEAARERRHAARAAKAAAASLPSAPSRADVLGAMAKVQPAVVRCMSGTHGIVTADMKIEGATGRVMSVNVSGAPGGAGSCIAGAVRKAKFPQFSQQSIAVRYPMKI